MIETHTRHLSTSKSRSTHPNQREWLSPVNAGILKVKLATALIGISSIHLLKTFINPSSMSREAVIWQITIHITFVLSAIALAWIDRLTVRDAGPVS